MAAARKAKPAAGKTAAKKPAGKKSVAKKAPAKPAVKAAKPAGKKAPARREPTQAAMIKKVAAVSDATKSLSGEVKSIGRIFSDNQKIMVSIKSVIDSVASSLEEIHRQSRQINMLEEDTKKIFAGLNQARDRSASVARLEAQAAAMKEAMARIEKSAPGADLAKQVGDSVDSIRNNSHMIIKIAQRVDEVREQLREVSGKAEAVGRAIPELEAIRARVDEAASKAGEPPAGMAELRAELEKVASGGAGRLGAEMERIGSAIAEISEKADRMAGLEVVVNGLKRQFDEIAARADPAGALSAEMESLKSKMDELVRGAPEVAAVRTEVSSLRGELAERAGAIETRLAEIGGRASEDAGNLMRLSEIQSRVRMASESKYGGPEEISRMCSCLAEMGRLPGGGPEEAQRWAVAKIMDCADKWEVRLAEVMEKLRGAAGDEKVAGLVRMQQVREIYGTRGADQVKADLGL